MVTGTRSAKLQANWESGQRIRGARREVFRTFFLVPVKPFKRFCGIKIHARDLHRQAPQDGGQKDTQSSTRQAPRQGLGAGNSRIEAQGCLGGATTCGQPCHGTRTPRPGYQTFPILSLVGDELRRVGPAVQAKKGRNKAVVRDGGGGVLQEEADFELSAASRIPSSFSDNSRQSRSVRTLRRQWGCWRSALGETLGLINC